jgi:hypothetical protein
VGNSPVHVPPIFGSSPIGIQAPDLQPQHFPAVAPFNVLDAPELPDYSYVTMIGSGVCPWQVEGDGQTPSAWHHGVPDNGNIDQTEGLGEKSRSPLHLSANGSNGNPELPAQVDNWILPPTVVEDEFSQASIVHPQFYQRNLDNNGFDPFHTPQISSLRCIQVLPRMPFTET